MNKHHKPATTAKRVSKSRARMRAKGLRLVQIWVPDTRAPGFRAELARQCRELAGHPDHEVDAWVDQQNAEMDAELEAQEAAAARSK